MAKETAESILDAIFTKMFNEAKEELLDIVAENIDLDSWDKLKVIWARNGNDTRLINRAVPNDETTIKKLYKKYKTEFDRAFDNHDILEKGENNVKTIYCYLHDELMEEISVWGEDLLDYVNEKREDIEAEITELERQLEDAEDAEDEDMINHIEAEIQAFDVESQMLGILETLTVDSI